MADVGFAVTALPVGARASAGTSSARTGNVASQAPELFAPKAFHELRCDIQRTN